MIKIDKFKRNHLTTNSKLAVNTYKPSNMLIYIRTLHWWQ